MLIKTSIVYIICGVYSILVSSTGNLQDTPDSLKNIISNNKSNDYKNDDAAEKPNNYVTYSKVIVSDKVSRKAFDMNWFNDIMSGVLRSSVDVLRGGRIGPDREYEGRVLGGPCNCTGVTCMCCSNIHLLGYNNYTCANIEYDPAKDVVMLNIKVQQPTGFSDHYHTTFHTDKVKTKCIPIPIPYLDTGTVDMCMGFYNVSQPVVGILHMCMAVNVRLQRTNLMTLFFDCMDMGPNVTPPKPDYDYPVGYKYAPETDYIIGFPSTSPIPPSQEEPYYYDNDFYNEFYPKPKKKKKRNGSKLSLTPKQVDGIAKLITKLLV